MFAIAHNVISLTERNYMTETFVGTSPIYTATAHGNNEGKEIAHSTAKILESIGNSTMHELNNAGVIAKAVSDNSQVINQNVAHEGRNTDNKISDVERSSASQTTSLLLDGTATRFQTAAEGRNTDNKISDSERYSASQFTDAAVDRAHSFASTALAISESKFATSQQGADLARYMGDKFATLTVEVLNQGSKGRELLLSENLAALRSKACCCGGHNPH
jgi:hypothetical protein